MMTNRTKGKKKFDFQFTSYGEESEKPSDTNENKEEKPKESFQIKTEER